MMNEKRQSVPVVESIPVKQKPYTRASDIIIKLITTISVRLCNRVYISNDFDVNNAEKCIHLFQYPRSCCMRRVIISNRPSNVSQPFFSTFDFHLFILLFIFFSLFIGVDSIVVVLSNLHSLIMMK